VLTELTSSTNLLASIGDPEGTRTVTSIVGLLVALGLALAMVAVWLFRMSRPDPELLAPLEMMGERKWRRADPVAQRRTLDAVRPEEADPLTPSAAPPVVDETFDAGPTGEGFEDLDGDGGSDVESLRPSRPLIWPPVGEVTPREIERPDADSFSDVFSHEIDPDVLAAAAAELDADLQRESGSDADVERQDELDSGRESEVHSEADAD